MPPPKAASRSTSSTGEASAATASATGSGSSSAKALSPTRFTPSAAESAILDVKRRMARSASSLPGITKSTTVGSQLVSTTATTGMPSLRASFTAIASLFRSEEANGAQRVVVAGNHEINHRRIAVGVHHGHHGNAQLAGFLHGNRLVVRVHNKI